MAASALRNKLLHVGSVLREDGDANAGVDGQLVPADQLRGAQGRETLIGHQVGVAPIRDLRQQDRELVTAQTSEGVLGAQAAPQPLRNHDEHPVSDFVPKAVVDVLEPIEVQEQNRHCRIASLRHREGPLQPVVKQRPVRQPG